jgi:hypothetical protein
VETTTMTGLTHRLRRARGPRRLHRWGLATATTADGVVAEIEVEYVVRLTRPTDLATPSDPDSLEMAAADAVEEQIRRVISASRVDALPTAGDRAAWAEDVELDGVTVAHAVVARSDVQVTPELRRLVGSAAGVRAWT